MTARININNVVVLEIDDEALHAFQLRLRRYCIDFLCFAKSLAHSMANKWLETIAQRKRKGIH